MEQIINSLYYLIRKTTFLLWFSILLLLAIVSIAASSFLHMLRNSHAEITTNKTINITPAQIQSIRNIGQWEFLSISDEELIDTISEGFFSDNQLAHIYYGTLRLGIDLSQTKDNWLRVEDTVVVATLPPITLLDQQFIDEARTTSFFESGSWTDNDREALYQRAYQAMLRRCLTKANVEEAEHNAREQFTRLLNTMGFRHVRIEMAPFAQPPALPKKAQKKSQRGQRHPATSPVNPT